MDHKSKFYTKNVDDDNIDMEIEDKETDDIIEE